MERFMSKEGDGAEEALLSSEQELRLLVDTIPTLVWTARPEGDIEYVNKRVLEYLGATLDEIIGNGWVEKVHPDDVAFKTRTWVANLESRTAHDAVCRFRGADGQYRWFAISGAPLKAGDGRVLRWYGVIIDIDDRRKAEVAIRESEYKLRQIIETVPSLLWSAGPDGEPTYANQRILDYTGVPLEDFRNRSWERFLHPDDLPETVKAFHHAIKSGTSYESVHRLRRSDGEYRWHHARGEPLRDRQGNIIQWYGLSVDIDEGKKAEDRLRRSEAYLAEAQRLTHTGSAVYTETEIPYWSDEASRLFGFDPLQGIPSREAVWQRFHPDDVERVNETIERAVREKRSFGNEFRIIHPDGTIRHVEAINDPVFSASGQLLEIVATGIDVPERKGAEEALRESEAKFRDYAETASDWLWEIGPDYKFTLLTDNAFGSGAADRIGTACWDHALDLETEPEKWRLALETLDARKPFREFVYCSARSHDTPIYVKASGKPVFESSGEFRGYRGTGTDVTAIMDAQEALRESERSSRSAIDGIAGLVAVMAPNGELETV